MTRAFLHHSSAETQENLEILLPVLGTVSLWGHTIMVKDLHRYQFFTVTSILLILFAAGLVAHGVHELQEAGVIPILVEHVWDINPALNPDGSYPLLHENGVVGELFKGLFGYNGNPSLIEVLSYIGYLAFVAVLWGRKEKSAQHRHKDSFAGATV